jgi:short-subunit dehydrogenase
MITDKARIALITGASSGIGVAFARRLAVQGYDLILVARREERLIQLATELQQQFIIRAETIVADLANAMDVERIEYRIAELPMVELLVNNAGFGVPGKFAEIGLDKTVAMIDVHIIASTRLTYAALPAMIARGKGAIINVASIGGFIPRPQDAVYCATKAYLISFSEALQEELAGTGVQVQALCPGFVQTEFLDSPEYKQLDIKAKIPKWLWTPVEQIVEESLCTLKCTKVICIPGFRNRVIVALAHSGLVSLMLKILENSLRRPRQVPASMHSPKRDSTL